MPSHELARRRAGPDTPAPATKGPPLRHSLHPLDARLAPTSSHRSDTSQAGCRLGRRAITRRKNAGGPIWPTRARPATRKATRRWTRRATLHPSQARPPKPCLSFGRPAPHNGLELSCPAEAGRPRRILRQAGSQGKALRKRRPPGQLQRVVRRRAFLHADATQTGRAIPEGVRTRQAHRRSSRRG